MHQKRTYFPVFLLLGLSALLLCFALLAPQWASSHSQWVEEVYSQILYPAMGLLSAQFLGIFPFSVGEFLLYGLIGCGLILLVWLIVLLCRKKWGRPWASSPVHSCWSAPCSPNSMCAGASIITVSPSRTPLGWTSKPEAWRS